MKVKASAAGGHRSQTTAGSGVSVACLLNGANPAGGGYAPLGCGQTAGLPVRNTRGQLISRAVMPDGDTMDAQTQFLISSA